MGILIVGANGATGVNLVKQILKNGRQVKSNSQAFFENS